MTKKKYVVSSNRLCRKTIIRKYIIGRISELNTTNTCKLILVSPASNAGFAKLAMEAKQNM